MKAFLRFFLIICAVILVYNVWVLIGVPDRQVSLVKTTVSKEEMLVLGADSGKGNIVGIQPYLTTMHYANIPGFKETLRSYLLEAKKHNWLNTKTILVFPENIGNWLIAYEQKNSVYTEKTTAAVLDDMVKSNIFKYLITWLKAPAGSDKKLYTSFTMKGQQAGQIYQEVFSELAKEFGVTIHAGSIILSEPSISGDSKIITHKGKLYNSHFVFNPDGTIKPEPVKKEYQIQSAFNFSRSSNDMDSALINTGTAKYSMDLLFAGDLWDVKTDGRLLIMQKDTVKILPAAKEGRMVNLWIE